MENKNVSSAAENAVLEQDAEVTAVDPVSYTHLTLPTRSTV